MTDDAPHAENDDPDAVTLRAAIVVTRAMEPAAVANSAAILMGQLAHLEPRLYAPEGVTGADGVRHAGIRYNTVVLTGRPGQVATLVGAAVESGPDVRHAVFTTDGRSLSNSFEEYRDLVGRSTVGELDVCAVGLVGADAVVRELTRRFSSYRGPGG